MVPQLHVEDRSSRRTTIAFVKGQSVTQNLFFGCPKTFSRASCALKDFRNKKTYKDVGSSMERFLRSGCTLNRKPFFKQCERVGKTKKCTLPSSRDLASKPLLEFLKSN